MNEMRSARVTRPSIPVAQLEAELANIIKEMTGHPISDPKADLAAAGIDSVTMLDLLATLETRFNVGLTEDVVQEFRSIHRIAHIVRDAIRLPK